MSSYFKHRSTFFRRFLNETIIIILLIMVGTFILWNAQTRIQDTLENQQKLVDGSSQSASHEITLLIKEIRRQVTLFANEHAALLDTMATEAHDPTTYAKLKEKVETFFPDAFAFTISDFAGQVLLDDFKAPVGNGCRADILSFSQKRHSKDVYIHGNPSDPLGNHFDMMSAWGDADDSEALGGIFFVSFKLDDIQRLLHNAQIPDNQLITVKRGSKNLIEVTSKGARKSLLRDINLNETELNRINASREIDSTQWTLVNLPNKNLLSLKKNDIYAESLIIFLSFLAVSALMLYFMLQAKKQLETSQIQLVQSEKMASLGQMVAGLAHEINTPLGYVKSNLSIVSEQLFITTDIAKSSQQLLTSLQQSPKDPTIISKQLEHCLAKGQKLDNLTSNMLKQLIEDTHYGLEQISELILSLKDFSRIDRGSVIEYDVHECLDNVLKISTNTLKYKVEVIKQYHATHKIHGSPARMSQVFLNLINNGVQAIEKRGTITIQTSSNQEHVTITVSDTGIGIKETHLQQIFDPFFTTKASGKGTGLGLSIVQQIMKDEAGDIKVNSVLGKGTVFTLILPVA